MRAAARKSCRRALCHPRVGAGGPDQEAFSPAKLSSSRFEFDGTSSLAELKSIAAPGVSVRFCGVIVQLYTIRPCASRSSARMSGTRCVESEGLVSTRHGAGTFVQEVGAENSFFFDVDTTSLEPENELGEGSSRGVRLSQVEELQETAVDLRDAAVSDQERRLVELGLQQVLAHYQTEP